ncbi:MAG TPA: discoidin domain-containing protein [Blastocatellia bacterium]|nr:discoidin domain-containing protein [Blastocatellia bacterium]
MPSPISASCSLLTAAFAARVRAAALFPALVLVISSLFALTAQAQNSKLSLSIRVSQAALPVTIGVPLPEAADVRDVAQLGILDPKGAAVPAQMRVLVRWRGLVTDTTKPVKWVLVDFKPSTVGSYVLTGTGQAATLPSLSISDSSEKVRLTTPRLSLEIARQGSALMTSLVLDGAEQLRAPIAVNAVVPRGGMLVKTGSTSEAVYLSDSSLLRPGDTVRFTHTARLKWDIAAGATQFTTEDQSLLAGHVYLFEEGTPRQETVTVSTARDGMFTASAPLRFAHAAGCSIRDLTIEQESAVIKSVSGQVVQFSGPLKQTHAVGECLIAAPSQSNPLITASAVIDRVSLEESNALRAVVRQDGHFVSATAGLSGRVLPQVSFTLRYYVYADQPFVRVRLRMLNEGTFGFGSWRAQQPPFSQHALIRNLSVTVPTLNGGAGEISVLSAAEAHALIAAQQSGATLNAGAFEISAPEFAENFPKKLSAASTGLRFDLLPDIGCDHNLEGGRAKTTDFYLGKQTGAAMALTNSAIATLDPAEVAGSGAVRPAMIERRQWSQVFAQDDELREAAEYAERMFAVAYAVESSQGNTHQPPQSVFEYRLRGEHGENFGWQNFGDLTWGDGYSNLHYDLPFMLLREFLRTGDGRAFRLGSEMSRFRADQGQYHADDYWDSSRTFNLRGLSFYEKGQHGTYREPVFTHHWIEGLWLYWALTGDEAIHESAIEASEAVARYQFTYDNALSWNESRFVGWPALAMMAAWRYSGDLSYLAKARDLVYLLIQTEEDYGQKGYYIVPEANIGPTTQPFMWSGYAQFGVIEFWRETGDGRAADFLVRVADWLIGKKNPRPVLTGGNTENGIYHPLTTPYFWSPDGASGEALTAQAMLSLPVLTIAARITQRADLSALARRLFRDTVFYRDWNPAVNATSASRNQINFRSDLFGASSPKMYGQTGFALGDYLAELNNAVTLPASVPVIPAPVVTPSPTPTVSSSKPRSCLAAMTFAGLTNVALNRPATASSVHLWPNATNVPTSANDGAMETSDGRVSLWHSESNTRQLEWWQVDLEQPVRIAGIEILFRTENNQSSTRCNFEVRASNDPTFATSTLLGAQGAEPHPFGQPWQAKVNDANTYRYVRVRKTSIDADEFGQEYFNLSEVRVWSADARAGYVTAGSTSLAVSDLRSQVVMTGQTLEFTLSGTSPCGQPVRHTAWGLPKNASFDSSTGVFTFTPTPDQASEMYQVTFRSGSAGDELITRVDIAVIQSGAPRVTLLSPTSSGRLVKNQNAVISWATDSSAPMTKYQLRLSTDGGLSYPTVIADLPGTATRFEWKIPAAAELSKAPVRLMVVATDANNRTGLDVTHQDLQVAETMAITSAASYRSDAMAAGSICTVFGGSLTSDGGGFAESLPLPRDIRGTRIEITDSQGRTMTAPLFYTSQHQMNFLLPEEAAPGEAVVTVFASTGEISETRISVTAAAPALFTLDASGSGEAALISTTDGVNYEAGAVKQDAGRDVYVVLFGTGWRGASAGTENNLNPAAPVQVEINGVPVSVLYAGKQPELAGLDQINFLLPRTLTPGGYSLVVRVGDQVSNSTLIRVY